MTEAPTSEATTRADTELDKLILKRRDTAADREREEMYARSVERHNARLEAELREGWIRYHLDQAERLENTAQALAAEHRERARSLREEGSS